MATTARQQYFADESSLSKEKREFSIADEIQEKINSVEEWAQVNKIEAIKVNWTALVPDAYKAVDIDVPEVIDNLYTVDSDNALSAKQWKLLYDYIQNIASRWRFLSNWNSATGLPITNPSESPYPYKSWDYFVVSNVATSWGTNYRPDGSSYVIWQASTVIETEDVSVSDFYFYDGTNWLLLSNSDRSLAVDTSLSTTSTNPVENRVITNAINWKQNTLIAWNNIQIAADWKTISATDTTYSAWANISIDANNEISAVDTTYTAWTNVQISNQNVISATDTKYTAWTWINIDANNVISNTQTSAEWWNITWTLSDQTDLQTALDAKQDNMVILKYWTSTWNDFITAYNKNWVIYCRASSNSNPASWSQTRLAFMAYVNNETTPTEVEFQYYRSRSDHNTQTNQLDEVYVYKLESNWTWSVTTRNTWAKAVAWTWISLWWGSGNMTISADTSVLATKTYVDEHDTVVSSTAPSSPTEWMLWYNTTNDVLNVYDGTQWNAIDTNTTYTAGNWINITNNEISADTTVLATKIDLNSKQDTISDLATIRSWAALWATALQPWDNVSELTNDAWYITSSYHDSSKQDVLTAGTGIDITWTTISATNNTKTFYLTPWSSATAIQKWQECYDWYKAWNNPIVSYSWVNYHLSKVDSTQMLFKSENDSMSSTSASVSTLQKTGIYLSLNWDTVTWVSSTVLSVWKVLATNVDYSTVYTPQYDWSPATKKYVDDSITWISFPVTSVNWNTWAVTVSEFSPSWTATTGYVVTKTANGYEWAAPSGWIEVDSASPIQLTKIWAWTQAQYEALASYDSTTVYLTI